MGKRTPLYETHVELGAKIVDFGGWDMPLHYGSQIEEHRQVRTDAGLFDVSHMTVVDLSGPGARPFLSHLVANNVDRLQRAGKALYTCMLNDEGGVIDDLIIFYVGDDAYRVVFNAATRDKVMAWVTKHAADQTLTINERDDLAMIAVQGPRARDLVHRLLDEEARQSVAALAPFYGVALGDVFVSRTGYTGEDGYEMIVPNDQATAWWGRLMEAGARPCGLGARDTLRLEAGMNLYGTDMDEATSPLEAGLTWTVAWEPQDRDFIGRKALEQRRQRGHCPPGSAWSWRARACCAITRRFFTTASRSERSPAAVSRRPSARPSPSPACHPRCARRVPGGHPRPACCPCGSSSRPLCATANHVTAIFEFPQR